MVHIGYRAIMHKWFHFRIARDGDGDGDDDHIEMLSKFLLTDG